MLKFRYLLFIAIILSMGLLISQKNNLLSLKRFFERGKNSEQCHIDDFVDYAMIRYFGIYTLFGFKPVTEINVQYEPPSEEYRKHLYENLSEDKKKEIPYTDFILNSPWGVSTKKQWKAFKNELKKYKLKDHFFVEYRYDYAEEEYTSILFVHQPSLMKLLDKYHAEFEKEAGEKFNSLKKVLELKRGGSKFWDKIFKDTNHYLMGLIFGYGEKNAKLFTAEERGEKILREKRVDHNSLEEIKKTFEDDVSIEDMCLPTFISYDEKDVIIEEYKEKRDIIIKCLKGKKLTKEVFKILEGKKLQSLDCKSNF
jgi:hypothetical protein